MPKTRKKISLPIMFFAAGCVLAASSMVSAQTRIHRHRVQEEILPNPRNVRLAAPTNCRQRSQVVAMESLNYPGMFLRHRGYSAALSKADNSKLFAQDSSFIVRTGLAGEGVSFESVNFPGYFLRHNGYSVLLKKYDGRCHKFAADASFHMQKGLAGVGTSLEPVSKPGHFVRHYGYRFIVSKYECKDLFREDATLILR